MVLEIRISPPPLLFSVAGAVSVIGLAKVTFALLACKSPERLTVPPTPLSEKAPASRVEFPALSVKTPVWLITHGPAFVEIKEPVIAKFVPVKLMPKELFVLRFPVIVVIPEPLDWVMDAAVIPRVVIFVADPNVSAPKRAVFPAAPSRLMDPVPALKVKLPGPFNVLESVIGLELLVSEAAPDTLTAPAKEIEPEEFKELLKSELPDPV